MMQQLSVDSGYKYNIGNKVFNLQTDFTYGELGWLDEVQRRLTVSKKQNEISGSFTRDEIKSTLKILLKDVHGNDFTDQDFENTKESFSVKIIADFFLLKALTGTLIKSCSMN